MQLSQSVWQKIKQETELRFARSSGPGGQSVNKTSTKVRLSWNVHDSAALTDTQRRLITDKLSQWINANGELVIQQQQHRSQHRNIEAAYMRLQELLAKALHRPKRRKKTKPTNASRLKRLQGKRMQAEKKSARRKPGSGD